MRRMLTGVLPGASSLSLPDLDRRPAYRLTQAQAADLLGVSTARVAEPLTGRVALVGAGADGDSQ